MPPLLLSAPHHLSTAARCIFSAAAARRELMRCWLCQSKTLHSRAPRTNATGAAAAACGSRTTIYYSSAGRSRWSRARLAAQRGESARVSLELGACQSTGAATRSTLRYGFCTAIDGLSGLSRGWGIRSDWDSRFSHTQPREVCCGCVRTAVPIGEEYGVATLEAHAVCRIRDNRYIPRRCMFDDSAADGCRTASRQADCRAGWSRQRSARSRRR